jgi:hypothetical protein
VPDLNGSEGQRMAEVALACVRVSRSLDCVNEISHIFHLPALLRVNGETLLSRAASWNSSVLCAEKQIAEYQAEIDDTAFRLYGMSGSARESVELTLAKSEGPSMNESTAQSEDNDEVHHSTTDHTQLTASSVSYFVGCVFGRWDLRCAVNDSQPFELSDPFAPLLVCAPGALTNADGLPLQESPPGYPLRVDWDGILVDDPDHEDDIIRRLRDVFESLWPKRADEVEREASNLLGVKELRDCFRKPGNGGFWMDHVRRYSKSRRKAPIYWLLRSSKGNYAIWLYYHRLDKDILFKALLNYVEPKLRLEENSLTQLRQQREASGTAGREAKQLEKQLDKQESFLSELYDFRDKLKRAADLNLEPDLNDGVVLNIAPLWELVPWTEAKKYWKELLEGKYEWSSIGKQLRERGMVTP